MEHLEVLLEKAFVHSLVIFLRVVFERSDQLKIIKLPSCSQLLEGGGVVQRHRFDPHPMEPDILHSMDIFAHYAYILAYLGYYLTYYGYHLTYHGYHLRYYGYHIVYYGYHVTYYGYHVTY